MEVAKAIADGRILKNRGLGVAGVVYVLRAVDFMGPFERGLPLPLSAFPTPSTYYFLSTLLLDFIKNLYISL